MGCATSKHAAIAGEPVAPAPKSKSIKDGGGEGPTGVTLSSAPLAQPQVGTPTRGNRADGEEARRQSGEHIEEPEVQKEFVTPPQSQRQIPTGPTEADKERLCKHLEKICNVSREQAFQCLETSRFNLDEALSVALAMNASPAVAARSEGRKQTLILPSHLRRSQTVSEILLESSCIGPYIFLPWNEGDPNIRANFGYDEALEKIEELGRPLNEEERFTDNDVPFTLSKRQQSRFHAWKRIHEFVKDPVIVIDRPASDSIRQGFVGDCSFLSSLSVLAEFEHRYEVPILTGLFYPQEAHEDVNRVAPVINPKGMYALRLHFNGVPRQVILDDQMPLRKDGRLLAAHSVDKREVWVTLIEKAFVKMMGGSYFIQGSNPGSDLYHLTGWLPETIPFKADVVVEGEATIEIGAAGGAGGAVDAGDSHKVGGYAQGEHADAIDGRSHKWSFVWDELFTGLTDMTCVACLGTSDVKDAAPSGLDYPEGVSISSGIVARHAYSILDFAQVGNNRFLYIKNPWGVVRWKGKFSPQDKANWTPELREALNYDPESKAQNDDGCFWMEWNDVCLWFSHLYMCWNATYFPYLCEAHSRWEGTRHLVNSILHDDSHLVAYNPQFHLQIHPPNEDDPVMDISKSPSHALRKARSGLGPMDHFMLNEVEVWILLSRHVKDRSPDLNSKYLAVHVHVGNERVLCPPPPAKQGVYSNGECSLVKLECNGQSDTTLKSLDFVLVVSQYSNKEDFNFTLKTYSHAHTSLKELPPLVPQDWSTQRIQGKWLATTAGGCSNDLWKYFRNPHYRLFMPEPAEVVVFLESLQEYSVNLRCFPGETATPRVLRTGKALSSGPYRAGCCAFKAQLHAGNHVLVVSSFRPGDEGDYQLSIHAPRTRSGFPPELYPMPWAHCIHPPPPLVTRISEHPPGLGKKVPFFFKWNVTVLKEPALLSVRVEVKELSPATQPPSIIVYKGKGMTEVFKRGDLEGGISDDGKSASSASTNLYKEQGVATLTLADLDSRQKDYTLVVQAREKGAEGKAKIYLFTDSEDTIAITPA